MNAKIFVLLALGFTAGIGARAEERDTLPVIGLDASGRAAHATVSEEEYAKRLGAALKITRSASLSALNRQSESETRAKRKWRLRSAIVGVGVSGEIGFGPFKVGAYPRFRLVFSNSLNPVTP